MLQQTVYLKITSKNGSTRIEQREVWDKDKFFANVTEAYANDKENPSKVTSATREEYLQSIKK